MGLVRDAKLAKEARPGKKNLKAGALESEQDYHSSKATARGRRSSYSCSPVPLRPLLCLKKLGFNEAVV